MRREHIHQFCDAAPMAAEPRTERIEQPAEHGLDACPVGSHLRL